MLLQLSQFVFLYPSLPGTPHLLQHSPLSSCSWVMHISPSAAPCPILFLISPCLCCTYQLCFLTPEVFSPFSLFPLPNDNSPNDLHIYDSVSVQFVCLVCFLDSVVDSCEFIAILMFIVLIFFFFLNKSISHLM